MTKVTCVENLIQEPNRVCYATVSEKGMIVSWGKSEPGSPTEGLHIHIPREKMLELANAINEVKGMTDKDGSMGPPTETGSCFRCGSPEGEVKKIWNNVYCICRCCERKAEEVAEEAANLYLFGKSDCFIGFRVEDIPELKRLFAQSESEDIRKMVEFLEDVEADIRPKEVKG